MSNPKINGVNVGGVNYDLDIDINVDSSDINYGNGTVKDALDTQGEKIETNTEKFGDLIGHGSHIKETDIDTLTHPGTYLCLADCTNIPNNDEWFTVNVFTGGTGSFIQQAIGVTSNTMYYRHHDSIKWSSWRRNFNFGIDSNGNYGYIKDGADTVTPFNPSMGACVYTTSTSSSLATIRIITGNKTTYNNDNIGHSSALSGLEYDLFTLKYVSLNWTITLKRNCYVNGVLRLSGETFNWVYTAVNYYLIIPA